MTASIGFLRQKIQKECPYHIRELFHNNLKKGLKMKNRSYSFFVAIIILSMSFSTIAQANATQKLLMKEAVEPQSTISGDVVFPFVKGLHLEDSRKWNLTDDLDVNKTLDNIPSFEGPGITAYTGSDVVPQISANRYLVQVTFINATIYDDHDIIGAGDIYFNVTINGNFTQTAEYETHNDETIFLDMTYFTAWCFTLDISVEAWDADTPPTPDDELGVYQYQTTSPTSQNISGLTDLGDALIWMEIEVLDTASGVTAEFLADGCKPYLYFCDETTSTEEADEVYSRVLVGYDSTKGKNVVIVQYIYYWIHEYFPFPVDIKFHEYDFEEFLIFIDPSDPMNPYRYVFDDGSYVSNTHSSRIAIWENTATSSIEETEAYIYEDLIPLLGENYTTDYKIFNLAEATDELRTGLSGMTTMNIIVQTSFH